MNGNTILILGIVLAGLSAAVTFYGTLVKDRETKTELNAAHANNTNNLKEAYGIISNRTIEQFRDEKIPHGISRDEGLLLLDKAINKWVNDALLRDRNLRLTIPDSNGKWHFEQRILESKDFETEPSLELSRNESIDAHNTKTYYDLYLSNDDSPAGIDDTYIHVILNPDKLEKSNDTFAEMLTIKSKELFYQYCNWYDLHRSNRVTTHHQYKHIIIFVVSDSENVMNPYILKDELEMWMEVDGGKPPLFRPYDIILYKKSELTNIKVVV